MKQFASIRELAKVAKTRVVALGRKTGYVGWVSRANLGDDAMFEAAQSLVGRPLDPISTPRIEALLSRISLGGRGRFERIILGGGTLINEGYINVVETCLEQGIPMIALGTGVGSAGFSKEDLDLDPRWKEALVKFKCLGVRGPASLTQLLDAGIAGARVTGDLALALTPDTPLANWQAKKILFNTCAGRTDNDKHLLARFNESMAVILTELHREGWKVLPVAFHSDDIAPIKAVMSLAGLEKVPIVAPPDFEAYCCLANAASISISVRLHGSVFASMCGVPNLLLGYRAKCHDFASSIGATDAVIDYRNVSDKVLRERFEMILSQRDKTGRKIHASCIEHRERLRSYVAEFL